MDRFRSVMPVGNELTYKEQIKREQARHRYALTHIRPMIDTTNQYTTMPVKVKSKADYLKGKRQQEIDNENKSLLERLALIDSHPQPMYTGFNSYKYGHSLRGEKRHREAKKINTENLKMYKRIVKTNPTMNTRIYIKDYYNSHQVRPAPKYIPPLKNSKKKGNNNSNRNKGMTRSASEPISNKRNPLYNRAHTLDNAVHFNTSPDILLFNGIKTVSSKDVNIKLWEIVRELDYGYNGTDGIKVVSITNNNNKIQENSIIFSINQLIHLCKENELLSTILSKLLIINEEYDSNSNNNNNNTNNSGFETKTSPSTITTVTYSSLHEALNYPTTTDYVEELLNFLISYYIRINNLNILELSEEGERILDEVSEEERKHQENELILSDVINEEDENEFEENEEKENNTKTKEEEKEEEDFDHKVEIFVNRILASVTSEENKKIEEEKNKIEDKEKKEEEEEERKKKEENEKSLQNNNNNKKKEKPQSQVKPIKKCTNNSSNNLNVKNNQKSNSKINNSSSNQQQSKQNNKKNQSPKQSQQKQQQNQQNQNQRQSKQNKNVYEKEKQQQKQQLQEQQAEKDQNEEKEKDVLDEDGELEEMSNSFVNSILTEVIYEENENLNKSKEYREAQEEEEKEMNNSESKVEEEEGEGEGEKNVKNVEEKDILNETKEHEPLIDEDNELDEFSNTFVNDMLNTVVQEEKKSIEEGGEEKKVVDDEKEMIGNENKFNDTFKSEFTDTFADSFGVSNE